MERYRRRAETQGRCVHGRSGEQTWVQRYSKSVQLADADRVYMQTLQTSHMPTRFHYTSVASENYGLAPAEILLATDAELNSYVGLKKMAPYRVDRGLCASLVVFILVPVQL